LASAHVGRRVLVLVSEDSMSAEQPRPAPELEVPIMSGGEAIGTVTMLGGDAAAAPDAAELLHIAALAAVTTLALEQAREHAAQQLGAGLIDELRHADIDGAEIARRAARLGC